MPKVQGPYYKVTLDNTEEQFIRDNYSKLTNRQLADALGLNLTNLRNHLYRLGLKRMELEYWTDEQVEYLRLNYKEKGDVELAEIFNARWHKDKGWSKKHIEKKRRYLNLKRDLQQRKHIHARNKEAGRFAICPVKAWNKRGRAKEGELRDWMHSGRLTRFIKVGRAFVHYAPYLWEQHNGSIPEGGVIRFKDGNSQNVVIENLELIDKSENARRNVVIASQGLSDNYVVGMLTHGNKEHRAELLKQPLVINIKRQQLLIQREIKRLQHDRKNS